MFKKIMPLALQYNFFSAFILIIAFFISFRLIGRNEVNQIDHNIKILLRNEFNTANSYAVAKSIIDIERIGQFECSKLIELTESKRVFIDNSNMHKCKRIFSFLKSSSEIESLSGITYELSYFHKINFSLLSLELLIYLLIFLASIFIPKYFFKIIEIEAVKLEAAQNKIESQNSISTLSQKLAHDIRSPISTLNLISSKIENEDIKSLQLAVVKQINAIANNLLNESKPSQTPTEIPSDNSLEKMLNNLQKEYQFKSNAIKQKIIFNFNLTEITNFPVDQKLTSTIYSCLNNFIQNSIEATNDDGVIIVAAAKNFDEKIEITVTDDGKGIPEQILKRLGNEPLSYGKDLASSNTPLSGNGIALYNAKKELSDYNVELKIESEVDQGTKIKLILA